MTQSTIYDGDIIEVAGQRFRVNFESDCRHEYPWDNDDGCGIVRRSNKPHRDGQSDKAPGERPLNSAGRNEYQFYYDWQATMKKAKADGWNAAPYDAPGNTLRAVQQNYDYCRGFVGYTIMMRPYRVTVVKNGIRCTFNAVAKSWYQAWCNAVDEFGIVSRITVKPV